MNIDWKAPFQLAWDLGLFLVGSILLVIIIGVALLFLYAIIKTFFDAFRRAKAQQDSKKASTLWLKRKEAQQNKKAKESDGNI
jgi:phosphotransferase system  glucose/maltose/N-acetylglucosamine-specific IIC component